MAWPQQVLDKLKEAASARPIQCPRGWGEVTFNLDLGHAFYLPVFGISRTCPIGGVESCSGCKYPFKPEDAERLRENLLKLDQLRKEKGLTEGEYAIRRQMIIQLQDGTEAQTGDAYRTWAWIVGLPGFVITGAGFMLVPVAEPALWIAITIGGSVMMAVSGACAIVASTKRKEATEGRSAAG